MILNISDAAKKVNIARSTLYNMKKNGVLSFTKNNDGKAGIEESELARVFSHCFKIDKQIQLNTLSDSQTIDQLSDKIADLQQLIDKQKDEQLIELKIRLEQAEHRVSELIKITGTQSNQLLLTDKTPKKSWIRKLLS